MSDEPDKTAPPVDALAEPETRKVTPDADSLIGKVINNNYRIDALIGTGGMGEVYIGEHLFTGNKVAIKIVLQSLSRDDKVISLFKREARILSQLADDSIARYLDSVYDPELDRYCLIMDFIDGVPLSDHTKDSGPLDLDAAKRLMHRLADGLAKAHKLEVTHRDLSPDNVMLRGGSVDQAVLIDFGIAKSTEMTEGTLHGQFAGKFKFISPEQLGHFDGAIGPRTDVYGLALLIAAAVRGKALEMGNSVVDAVNKRREIPPLEGVYPELQPLLAHMLEPDPVDRPATMLDVARMVENPALIPPKYHGGTAPVTEDRTVIAGALPQATSHPTGTGLQAPPTAVPQPTTPPAMTAQPQEASHSPFGGTNSVPFSTLPEFSEPETAPVKKRGFGLVFMGLGLVAALGGGWYAMTRTPVTEPSTQVSEPAQETPDAQDTPEVVTAMPPPLTETREGFLASYTVGFDCSYATRVASGQNAGKIEVFSSLPATLAGLPEAYKSSFGAAPAIVERDVAAGQCAAMDLLRDLQGREALPPSLVLDTDSIRSGSSVLGRVHGVRGRTVWLFLVSAAGGVYNLSPRLEPQADGSFVFNFGMGLGEGADPAPQLIVALASDAPLVSAAAISEGADAAEVLPLVRAEIAQRGGTAAAQVGYFMLEPAAN